MSELEFGAVDPAEFAKAIAETPDEELVEGMRSDARGEILDEIFRRMEQYFDPSKSAQLDLVVHFVIEGQVDGDPDFFEVVIREDTCTAGRERTADPGLGLQLEAVDFLRLITNQVKGMDLYLERRMKIDGNVIMATRLTGLFTTPGEAEAASAADTTPTTEGQ
jgi:alkyl sulfatase BDS1-like metallo-beta-lactamase superfamily hydrolase